SPARSPHPPRSIALEAAPSRWGGRDPPEPPDPVGGGSPTPLSMIPCPAPTFAAGRASPELNPMHLRELKQKPMADLVQLAKGLNIEGAAGLRKQELIFALLQAHAALDQAVYGDGVLECLPDGFGF